jgi:hypothetical protein
MSGKTLSRRRWFIAGGGILLVALILGLIGAVFLIETLPERISQHETILLGQSRLEPGSTAAMRVVVRDSRDAAPMADAAVKVLLKPAQGGRARQVFEGETGATGTLDVRFPVPASSDGDQTLIVETSSKLGSDRIEKTLTLTRDVRLLVTTDKPLYQPGQLIHLRALALGAFDRRPVAGRDVTLTIADGKGNTVFRKILTTSDFGVVATDFQLADEVNTGPYKIAASLGDTTSEKTVTVEHYTLPKFNVILEADRDFYQPGDRVAGTVQARYFYGKDVAGARVVVEGYTYDVERKVSVAIEGETDGTGTFVFDFDLPDYIVGTELEDGRARFYLEARVTDLAEHTEIGRFSLPVSQSSLVIDAIPEGGVVRPGVENLLYILASYPDGAPAEADISVHIVDTGERFTAETGPYGLAELVFTPTSPYLYLDITAQDASGAVARRDFTFEGAYSEESVLLRPDAPVYRVGDTMSLTLLTSQSQGTVYLDIVREGQTVSTRAVDVSEGRAEVAVDLTPDLYDTLELHAYKILRSGSIVRDTRLVVVDQADDLAVRLTPGADVYQPGEDATLDVRVMGEGEAGVQAAVGLAVVDESVFALSEQDPGFAKLYFMLEEALLAPKYELHGFSIPDIVTSPCQQDEGDDGACPAPLRDAQARAGKAALASTASGADPFTLSANSHEQAMARAYDRQQAFYDLIATGAYALFLIIPLGIVVAGGLSVIRDRMFWKSFGLAVAASVVIGLSLLGLFWLVNELLWRVEELFFAGFAMLLGLGSVAGLIVLIVVAVRHKDWRLGTMIGLLPLLVGITFILGFSAMRADLTPPDWTIWIGIGVVVLLPLAFMVRGAGFIWQKRWMPGMAALILGLMLVGLTGTVVGGSFYSRSITAGVAEQAVMLDAMEDGAMAPAPDGAFMGRGDVAVEVEKTVEGEANAEGAQPAQGGEPPRLRQYFPETMLWLPDEVTDAEGHLSLSFPVADSITTWRVTALASSQDGRLGSSTGSLRVFQDFFIDLDLPGSLTVGDEIAIPVGVFNYMTEGQTVRLEVETAPWFDLLDEPVKEIEIAANDITVVYFRIRAEAFGRQPFQVTAYGSQMSDAIRKEVHVFPDGKELRFSVSDKLTPTAAVEESVRIPQDVIPGTQTLMVKIYPGVVSQVVEGLDALLRMPFGCFEQTSSTTYPNVLVLDYLKTTDQASPEVQMKAEQYINLGYQRLTTFEVDGEPGGFSLFGDAPADPMLTAYGLQEFGDMSRVYEIDPGLIQRIVDWLYARQHGDGSWAGVEGFHETNITNQTGRIPVTAFIVWGLADAGYADNANTGRGVSFLREHASEAESAYDLAMVANALVAVDIQTGGVSASTEQVLERLVGMAQREGESVYWDAGRETYMGGYGASGRLETTASAALAMLRAERHGDLANDALTYLVRNKDSFGTWETTSATVMALKALIESVRTGSEDVDAMVTVTLNGGRSRTISVTPETFDVVQMLVFDDVPAGRDSVVGITMEGHGNLMYQVTGRYYLGWATLPLYPDLVPVEDLVAIDVQYDRTELQVDDTVEVGVTVSLRGGDGETGPAVAEQAIIDLGVPPGFSVETEDLARLVARFDDVPLDYAYAQVKRFELTGRQIILYVSNLTAGEPLSFSYRLRANYPLVAKTPASSAYDYYNPSTAAEAAPLTLTVAGD